MSLTKPKYWLDKKDKSLGQPKYWLNNRSFSKKPFKTSDKRLAKDSLIHR